MGIITLSVCIYTITFGRFKGNRPPLALLMVQFQHNVELLCYIHGLDKESAHKLKLFYRRSAKTSR